MWRKMLAVVVTATLVGGTAWGLDLYTGATAPAASGWVEYDDSGTAGTDKLPSTGADALYGIVNTGAAGALLTHTGDVGIGGGGDAVLYIGRNSLGATDIGNKFTFKIVGDLTVSSDSAISGHTLGAAVWVGNGNTLKINGQLVVTEAGAAAGTDMGIIADGAGALIESNTLKFDTVTAGAFITAKNGGIYRNLGTADTTITGAETTDGLRLMGGDMSFGGKLIMDKGTIYATTGINNLAVDGDGLVIAGDSENALINVAAGAKLNVKKTLEGEELANVSMAAGTITFGTTGAATDTALTVGALNINQSATAKVVFTAPTTAIGTINATSLSVKTADGGAFVDAVGVNTIVSGKSEIDVGIYRVAGRGNQYNGGLDIKTGGVLQAGTAGATDTTGTAITTGEGYVNMLAGSTINTDANLSAATIFTINGKGVKIAEINTGNTTGTDMAQIDASLGTDNHGVTIAGDLDVAGNLELKTDAAAASVITVAGKYNQTAGIVTENADANFTVTGDAIIGGAGKDAIFNVISDGDATSAGITTFTKGLTIGEKGVFVADDNAARAMTIGEGASLTLAGGMVNAGAAGLTLTGTNSKVVVTENGSVLNAGTVAFTAVDSTLVVDAEYKNTPSLLVTGTAANFDDVQVKKGELALGNITLATDKNVTVDNGAYIAHLGGGAATIAASGAAAAQAFTAKAGSNIEAHNGSFVLTGFDTADLDGNVLIGATGGDVNTIASDADATTVGATANIVYNVDAVNAIKGMNLETTPLLSFRNTSGDVDALAISDAAKVQLTSVGQFTYEKNADGGIYLIEANNLVNGDDTEKNRGTYLGNLRTAWAPKGAGAEIDSTLASASFYANQSDTNKIVVRNNPATPEYDGRLSLNLLAAMHSKTDGYTQGVGKAIFRNGNVSEMLNAGIGEIGGITSAIGARNTQLRGQMAGAGDVYYEYANPSLILNNEYANRVWAGYIGQWEKGDARNGVAGYDYDSNGFIVGYDRLVGCNFAFGGAFAYSRGDYEDKAALSNSSKIDNYSFNGYMTYSALNGVFASLFAGYTHQKNDIEGIYANGVSGKSDYDTDYWHIGGRLGYDFQPLDGLVLTPSIGLQYIHGRADSHTARIAQGGLANVHFVDSAKQEALLLPIELAAKYNINFSDCSRLTIEGNVGYSYNFINDNGAASMVIGNVAQNGNAVAIDGYNRDAGRHTFNAGAGLRYTFNRFDVGVKYDYYLQSDAHAHRLMGTVGVSF